MKYICEENKVYVDGAVEIPFSKADIIEQIGKELRKFKPSYTRIIGMVFICFVAGFFGFSIIFVSISQWLDINRRGLDIYVSIVTICFILFGAGFFVGTYWLSTQFYSIIRLTYRDNAVEKLFNEMVQARNLAIGNIWEIEIANEFAIIYYTFSKSATSEKIHGEYLTSCYADLNPGTPIYILYKDFLNVPL